MFRYLLIVFLIELSFPFAYSIQPNQSDNFIHPGDVWPDDRGLHIQAHGGGIIHLGSDWFWFGEDRTRTDDKVRHFISCYSSSDLVHWKFCHQVIASGPPFDIGQPWILERPKVFYNAATKKFVMYCHLDGPAVAGDTKGKLYARAMVGVAVCDTIDGDYKFVSCFRPLGLESRDIGQFIDDDGTAYLVFESRPSHGFYIAKLSEDYLKVEKEVAFVHQPLEGGHWSITAVATSSSPPILQAGPLIQTSTRRLQNWRGLGPNLKTSLIRRPTPTDHNPLFS